jgi:hypothetical protein
MLLISELLDEPEEFLRSLGTGKLGALLNAPSDILLISDDVADLKFILDFEKMRAEKERSYRDLNSDRWIQSPEC